MTTPNQWRSFKDSPPGPGVTVVHVIELQATGWEAIGTWRIKYLPPNNTCNPNRYWSDATPPPLPPVPDPAEEAFQKWLNSLPKSGNKPQAYVVANFDAYPEPLREAFLAGYRAAKEEQP